MVIRISRPRGSQPQIPLPYPSQTWTVTANNGGFAATSTNGDSISGTFRGAGAAKVDGVFEVVNKMKGTFVARNRCRSV